MKVLKYIFTAVAAFGMMASCTVVGEDTFSTAPAAPTMVPHDDILVTATDIAQKEEVTFVWEEARYIDAKKYEYDLYVNYSGTDVLLAESIDGLKYSLKEEEFRSFLYDNFTLEPKNYTHTITVFVTITDDKGTVYKASPAAVKVFLYDDAVPAEVEAETDEVVLDIEKLEDKVALLRWEPARLVFGEEPEYAVKIKIADGEEVELEKSIYDNSFSCVVDVLNEKIVEAGGVENAENTVSFFVYAISDTYPEGVRSEAVTVKVTTYAAVYVEYLYVPGNHQGWDPAAAPKVYSPDMNGKWSGFCYLDGGFKFTLQPAWDPDQYKYENFKTLSEGITADGENLVIAEGNYYLQVDIKSKSLTVTEIESWGLIGDATAGGWDAETTMAWDLDKKCWKVRTTLGSGQLKFRANKAWDIDLGGDLDDLEYKGGNIELDITTGKYDVELYTERVGTVNEMYCTLTPVME